MRSAIFAIVAILVSTTDLAAQFRIAGHVVDNQTLDPIAASDVEVYTIQGQRIGRAISDDAGIFHFTARRDGGYYFRVTRIGYKSTQTPILWTDGYRDVNIEIRMDPDAVLLAPIEIVGRARREPSPVLENFRARQQSGLGVYFSRADVEEMQVSRVSDILERVPGVHFASSGRGMRRTIYMSRAACPAEIFIDGMLWTRTALTGGDSDLKLDDAVAPEDIEGVEVYHGLATVPAEFLTPRSKCGVVAIWTRR